MQLTPVSSSQASTLQNPPCSPESASTGRFSTAETQFTQLKLKGILLKEANNYVCVHVLPTCRYTKVRKRNSYSVQLESGGFGEVDCYVSDGVHHLALVRPLSPAQHSCLPEDSSPQLKATVDSLIVPVQRCATQIAVPIQKIVQKCVSVRITSLDHQCRMYIVQIPNHIERDQC